MGAGIKSPQPVKYGSRPEQGDASVRSHDCAEKPEHSNRSDTCGRRQRRRVGTVITGEVLHNKETKTKTPRFMQRSNKQC